MGLAFGDGVVFAGTASNATIVAINSTDGKTIWQSQALGNPKTGYRIILSPIVWKDYVIAGSAGGGTASRYWIRKRKYYCTQWY